MMVLKDELETGTVYWDVDDTLILWDNYEHLPKVTCNNYGKDVLLSVHQDHVNQLKRFKSKGWVVVVWSQGGAEWAEEVINKLELNEWVDVVLTKPRYIFDDLDTKLWMPHRRYISPEKKD